MEQILNILGSVGFNWHVALANFINFLIILFVLNKFFFGKLGRTISERQNVISKGIAQASEAEKALANAEEKKREIIHSAKKESHAIISEAEIQAKELAVTIKNNAEKEAELRMASISKMEEDLSSKVEKDFSEKAPYIVAKLYAKSLRANLSDKDNNELIASMK